MRQTTIEKNEEELPIPYLWRPIFKSIVHAFVKHDYFISNKVKNVNPVPKNTAEQIEKYIEDYGEKLVELPDETWDTSVYIFNENHWVVLIDLYTEHEGRSDLVLKSEVRINDSEYQFDIILVYVP